VVGTMVEPRVLISLSDRRQALGGELLAVELADEVLRPEPPAGPPGLRLTTSTQRVSCGSPSTGSSNRSGHSQMPAVAPAGPKSLRWCQVLRSSDRYSRTTRSTDSATTITQWPSGAYQNTLGSRKSVDPMSSTGLPSYRLQVRPRSTLCASACVCRPVTGSTAV
jgi:hypothetical protein